MWCRNTRYERAKYLSMKHGRFWFSVVVSIHTVIGSNGRMTYHMFNIPLHASTLQFVLIKIKFETFDVEHQNFNQAFDCYKVLVFFFQNISFYYLYPLVLHFVKNFNFLKKILMFFFFFFKHNSSNKQYLEIKIRIY